MFENIQGRVSRQGSKQVILNVLLRGAKPAFESLILFKLAQFFPCMLYYPPRNARKLRDLQAITLISRAWTHGVQKNNTIAMFSCIEVYVIHTGISIGKRCQFKIMGGEQGHGVNFRRNV